MTYKTDVRHKREKSLQEIAKAASDEHTKKMNKVKGEVRLIPHPTVPKTWIEVYITPEPEKKRVYTKKQ